MLYDTKPRSRSQGLESSKLLISKACLLCYLKKELAMCRVILKFAGHTTLCEESTRVQYMANILCVLLLLMSVHCMLCKTHLY